MYLLSSIALYLQCIVKCAQLTGFLDEEDFILLEQALTVCRSRRVRFCALIQFGIFIFFGALLLSKLFDISLWICSIFATTILLFCLLFLPFCLLKNGFTRIDDKFQKFLSSLKRRECCLFSGNFNGKNGQILPLKNIRRQCLCRMRRRIAQLTFASNKLYELRTSLSLFDETSSDEKNHLISTFINDELRLLTSEDVDISDDFLQISALRTCWQYLFLLRSEFFRMSIVSIFELDNLPQNQNISFFSNWKESVKLATKFCLLFIQTMAQTSCTFDVSKFDFSSSQKRNNLSKALYYNQSLTPLDSAIFQLEWILENLHKETRLPKDSVAQSLIASLNNVIALLSEPQDNGSNQFTENVLLNDNYETNNLTDVKEEIDRKETLNPLMKKNSLDSNSETDFQIFEMDTGKADCSTKPDSDSEDTTKTEMFEFVDRRPLLRELRSAISMRKDICIQREMIALAKLRNVPLEAIEREELERQEFKTNDCENILEKEICSNEPKSSKSNTIEEKPNVNLCRGAFGGMPNAIDLKEILSQRNNFSTLVTASSEQFGFSDDEND